MSKSVDASFESSTKKIALRPQDEGFDRHKLEIETDGDSQCLSQFRKTSREELLMTFSFASPASRVSNPVTEGIWMKIHDSPKASGAQKILLHGDVFRTIPLESTLVFPRRA